MSTFPCIYVTRIPELFEIDVGQVIVVILRPAVDEFPLEDDIASLIQHFGHPVRATHPEDAVHRVAGVRAPHHAAVRHAVSTVVGSHRLLREQYFSTLPYFLFFIS